jgi:cation transport ATPase
MALGTQGLTAAVSAADTVLLSTDTLRVTVQGIWMGMGLSAIAMLFAAFGFIPPAGALIQEGFDVIVILNALRAGRATF